MIFINLLLIHIFIFVGASGNDVEEINYITFEMSNNEILPQLSFIETHGNLLFLIPGEIHINRVRWDDLYNLTLLEGNNLREIHLTPLGDNKLEISIAYSGNALNGRGYVRQADVITFTPSYVFPLWIKNTNSKSDLLISSKGIGIDLANNSFLEHFNIKYSRFCISINITNENSNNVISKIHWGESNPDECNLNRYFTKTVYLSPGRQHKVMSVFAKYFDSTVNEYICSIKIPENAVIPQWYEEIGMFHLKKFSRKHDITIDLTEDSFLNLVDVLACRYKIYIFFNAYLQRNRSIGIIKWGRYLTRTFDGGEIVSNIELKAIGDNEIGIAFINKGADNYISDSHQIKLPEDYEFPSWIVMSHQSFINKVKTQVFTIDLSNDHLPSELGMIQGFDAIELFIKPELVDKRTVNNVKWGGRVLLYMESEYDLIKIAFTALGDNNMGIGIFYKGEESHISRLISKISFENNRIPLWLVNIPDFIKSIQFFEKKLHVNLYNDKLDEELEIKSSGGKISISMLLDFIDTCTIKSVSWKDDTLLAVNDKFTIVKIYIEMIDNKYQVKILYYDDKANALKISINFEDKSVPPEWFTNNISL